MTNMALEVPYRYIICFCKNWKSRPVSCHSILGNREIEADFAKHIRSEHIQMSVTLVHDEKRSKPWVAKARIRETSLDVYLGRFATKNEGIDAVNAWYFRKYGRLPKL